jgi:pimeloyl-ACP methyl ester carboxylesterase
MSSAERERVLAIQCRYASHVAAQVLGSQTLANAMHDSPAGLCSYLLERRRSWSDCGGDVERCFTKDELLTDFTIYWATQSFATSVRYYREATLQRWKPSHDCIPTVTVPTAITVFRPDDVGIPDRAALACKFNLQQLRVHRRGGHFAPAERPDLIVADIRDAFRPLRRQARLTNSSRAHRRHR